MNPQYYSSPVATKAKKVNSKLIIGGIGLFVALLVGTVLMTFSQGDDTSLLLARSVARQDQMIALTKDASDKLRSGDLRKVNSDASLFLASDKTVLTSLMQNAGNKTVPKEVVAAEADSESLEKLAEADINSRYDSVYVTVMSQKLDAQQALLREISSNTNSMATRQGLSVIAGKLENIQTQLDKF